MGDAEERAEDGEYADDRVGPLPLSTRNFLHENKRALGVSWSAIIAIIDFN
jgi:hypothetical protein